MSLPPNLRGEKTYLENDPHTPLTAPSLFYEVSLDSKSAGGTFRVRGFSLVGAPGVLIGHNDNIGWGLTNLRADVDDVYIEFADDSCTHVSFDGKMIALRTESIP